MSFYIHTVLNTDFESAISKVTDALKSQGFGVITSIDVKSTLKNKIDVDFRPYTILGACNPKFAHKALQVDDKIGLLLPCNVVVQELSENNIEVSVMKPEEMLKITDESGVSEIVDSVKEKLFAVINSLNES